MTARLRVTLLAGAGFFLVQLGWILSISPHFGIDEFDHATRASSVAAGHWQPGNNLAAPELGRGDLIPVRADVANSVRTACQARPYTKVYNCEPAEDLGNGEVMIASGAARYNPTFYAIVGTVAAPFHATANLYALRVATALLGCGIFMMTLWLAAGQARTRWPVAVTLLAAFPTTVYSASIATPNGVNLLAGLGVWVALLAVANGAGDHRQPRQPRQTRSAYVLLGLSTAVLANFHTLGLLWLALIAISVGIIHGPRRLALSLWPRNLAERITAGLTGAAVAFELAWVVAAGTNDPATERTVFTGSPWESIFNGLLLWPLQAIGAFPMRDNQAPTAVYAIMLVLLVTVAVLTLRRTRFRSRTMLALAFVVLASYVVPTVMTVLTFDQIGAAWQGRYAMPFTVGLLVLAGHQLDRHPRPVARFQMFASVGAIGVLLAQLLSQWAVMTKQRADFDLVSGTHWVPPSAALLLTLTAVAMACWTSALALAPRTDVAPPRHEVADSLQEARR